jgi:surface protein
MKNLTQHIQEKLQISRNKVINRYTLFPKDSSELAEMINNEIEKNGPNCSLNHIDVSKIEDFSYVFNAVTFDGDISDWNVSNAKYMDSMFKDCSFTGKNSDISDWDVSKVDDMSHMFRSSEFNGDISKWNVSNVTDMSCMFFDSKFNGDISKWNVSNVTDMDWMFTSSSFNQDISNWDISNVTNMTNIFINCPLENNPPKWYNN